MANLLTGLWIMHQSIRLYKFFTAPIGPGKANPLPQTTAAPPDQTRSASDTIIGGVVAVVIVLIIAATTAIIVIAALVLRSRRAGFNPNQK